MILCFVKYKQNLKNINQNQRENIKLQITISQIYSGLLSSHNFLL